MVEEGKPAPTFTLRSETGEDVSLASLRGQPVMRRVKPDPHADGVLAALP